MESKGIRRIDMMNIIKFLFKKWLIIMLIGILCAGLLGGKKYFDYKVQKQNELFSNSYKDQLVYGSFVIYINNFDNSESYYNRIEDVTAIIKGYGCLNEVITANKINTEYFSMLNSVSTIPVGMNQLEVSIEGSRIGLSQEQVVAVTDSLCDIVMKNCEEYFGENSLVLIEEPHAYAYELHKALTSEEEEVKITKKAVVIRAFLGGVAGCAGAVILLVFYSLLSTVLRNKNEVIECYNMSLLGAADKSGNNKEEYKRALKRVADKKVLAMVSITDKEFRREAIDNLASVAAVNGKNAVVVRISADTSDVEKNGLYQYVSGKKNIKDMLIATSKDSVKMVDWSQASTEDIDLFTHEKFVQAMDELKNMFEYVFVDCPALSTSAAGLYVVSACDGVVVVGSCGNIKEEDVNLMKYNFKENDIECLGLLYIQ